MVGLVVATVACGQAPSGVAPTGDAGVGSSTTVEDQPPEDQPATPEPEGDQPAESTTTSTTGASAPADVDRALSPLIEIAGSDLAGRVGVDRSEIEVVAAEAVIWPDAALGCPRDGVAYAQVQVDGFRILLEAAGARHAYHGGGDTGPFLCENPA